MSLNGEIIFIGHQLNIYQQQVTTLPSKKQKTKIPDKIQLWGKIETLVSLRRTLSYIITLVSTICKI